MTEPLLRVTGLRKAFGAVVATDGLHLDVMPGEVHALIGPNGAGKTTLVAQLAGEIAPDDGRIDFAGADITRLSMHARTRRGLARSFQITSLFPRFTALENVALAVQARAGHAFRFWRPAWRDPTLLEPAHAVLARLGLDLHADRPASTLSHGEQRQLEIAVALATQPRLLLLDEPMAGLGPEDSAWMVELLGELRGEVAMLLIEHDMDAVFTLADRITVLVYGRALASGTPDAIRADPEVRRAYLGDGAEAGAEAV
ncbi:ABC transporter ATP-binding protein [Ferruginivarius sediminum]|uniref:ABC transporter ATP-binding protein n=1 Tax=Ferruginivarius sediminum TaxID=2661937 RepID=A0A369TBM0_9PROT|nr:ABC transporter ATP-binding protein [Ferruginivarius sediminum]RDD60326.1 ABC transporter ATP-binding protein [Ferruginivarius sediminum]